VLFRSAILAKSTETYVSSISIFEIASKQMTEVIDKHHEIITTKLGINRYDIRNQYDGRATITLDYDQFYKLVWAFQALARHEEHAQQLENERRQKAYEESQQEAVNA
jgi:hypothetical protein